VNCDFPPKHFQTRLLTNFFFINCLERIQIPALSVLDQLDESIRPLTESRKVLVLNLSEIGK
jgi:hypothetical protein